MGSATIFFARDGLAGRGASAVSGKGIGFGTECSANGNSGVVAADFLATFFTAAFLAGAIFSGASFTAATFFTAAFLAVAVFAGGASSEDGVAALLVARLRAGGVSPSAAVGICGRVS